MPRARVARLFAIALLLSTGLHAAAASRADGGTVPMREAAWDFGDQPHRFGFHRGRRALFIESGRGWIVDAEIGDGTIEYDTAIRDEQGFSGVAFRGVDRGNFEHFYLRHHLSGMPDASQYQPVYNGTGGWQIYAGAGFTAPVELIHDRWMHVRVDVNGDRAALYVDSDEPVLVIDDLQQDGSSGAIALNGGNTWFANVRITPGEPTIPAAPPSEETEPSPATAVDPIIAWRVSDPFNEERVGAASVSAEALGVESWRPLDATHRGIANLARVASRAEGRNTVIAAARLRSDGDRLARVRFGFSDRVRVYLNGRLLYAGADEYRSRDYRYLGTIGLFDELALPLEDGDNELWFAVSEDFGGWGIVAALQPDPGVTLIEP